MNDAVLQFLNVRDRYFSNAENPIQKRDFRKASELLWGAIAQAMKALGASSGITIRTRGQIRDFVKQIAQDMSDPAFFKTFRQLEALHRNFYDEEILEEEFPEYYSITMSFISKIDDLMKAKT
ncbi:MAG: hypothetical protein HY520_02435 [Candidatus Aenigmarchaeota archaeon]|nr:hypothetical protein [Candidatus Aenigmarchaeota archaeon]